MTIQTFAIRALTVTAMAGAGMWATPAAATADGPDYYRVVDVRGTDSLQIRARPSQHARSLGSIPFNARRIDHTGRYRRGWVRVVYGGQRGWVKNRFLAEDGGSGEAGTYKVTGLSYGSKLNIRRKPGRWSRVLGTIPYNTSGLQNCGACNGDWCPVHHNGVDGWVSKRFLKVERYPAYAPAYAQGQNDRPNDTDDWYENDVSYQTTADYG
ncbi:MAG: SH3 domain-containing protein, partial [Hyphomicrobiaceae bacterium]